MAAQPEPYRWTASHAVTKIRSGELTVERFAQSLLSQIAARNSDVQAWAYLNPDLVLEQARALDRIPLPERGPLHGVAIGIKDIFYTKDMPTCHNSPIYASDTAVAVDSGPVAILRQAGALILGKTTTTEFAATVNGTATKNPHDPLRTPGGSSSGSGAAVGDSQVPVAIGTQTGGSIIRPASFNGIYGYKPTWNVVSREGQKICSLILDTIGVYARCVADLQLMADVLNIKDDEMPTGTFSVRGAKFGLLKTVVWPQAGPGTQAAMAKAAELLRDHGATVEELSLPPDLNDLPEWHRTVISTDGRSAFFPEYVVAKSKISQFVIDQVENSAGITRRQQMDAFDCLAAARPRVGEILSGYDAVIVPSVPDEAPLGLESTGSAVFNVIWTAMHTPVVNIPGFCGENGMPIGVSLVAPRYQDRKLLYVCEEVGKIFESEGGWGSRRTTEGCK
ncbi:glutamyl-tRNA(Gln) amidotransferase subunit A [Gaeumannomyces tritici R3-111a-1]|uniref:Glutamyl-tRNA(Gln) amidotransferase subunit A n=1 Tax=Gaeumannomyces tritici (strain R3-111a-1) TaxID=644352 RepID=J3P640_GAET3|nr:glutamyl-tRNA(Gln) amidotransferase subunit A [Gaeumannomyces tritici R3-111a-1]EJT72113.1 glutamyl-tRNA(Gln) amidotransferase subunit A [Gaeumannomyces tritici R3-111a-1]